MNYPELEQVLYFVNLLRKQILNKDPLGDFPKGIRQSGEACPIALALNASVSYVDIHFYDLTNSVLLETPEILKDFLIKYDNGFYPQLEQESK